MLCTVSQSDCLQEDTTHFFSSPASYGLVLVLSTAGLWPLANCFSFLIYKMIGRTRCPQRIVPALTFQDTDSIFPGFWLKITLGHTFNVLSQRNNWGCFFHGLFSSHLVPYRARAKFLFDWIWGLVDIQNFLQQNRMYISWVWGRDNCKE